MRTSETVAKLMPALIKAAAEMADPVKNAKNPHYKSAFADLSQVLDVIKPALAANGCALFTGPVARDGGWILMARIYHTSGEWAEWEHPILAERAGPQGFGSGLSYARRYLAKSIVSLADSDDDAEIASNRGPVAPAPATKAKAKAKGNDHPAAALALPFVDGGEALSAIDYAMDAAALDVIAERIRASAIDEQEIGEVREAFRARTAQLLQEAGKKQKRAQ